MFIGNPRGPRTHPQLPFIACSHNLPSRFLRWRWLRWIFDIPPIVVLVRDPKEAMLSHFVKWREPMRLTLHDYVHKATTKRTILANAWWYIDFFNRWGRMAESAPDEVLVVSVRGAEGGAGLLAAADFRPPGPRARRPRDRGRRWRCPATRRSAPPSTRPMAKPSSPTPAERARMRFPQAENAVARCAVRRPHAS